jgi:cytochrome c5
MKRRTLALLAATPLALLASGCATSSPAPAAAAPTRPSTALAAGDAMGHTLFKQPGALTRSRTQPQPSIAEVPSR